MVGWYLCYGGGLGDVVWDFIRDRNAEFLETLKNDFGYTTRIYTQCHNDGVLDLFKHNPFVHNHINEPWHPPTREDVMRFNSPIDGFLPLHRDEYRLSVIGPNMRRSAPSIYLNRHEATRLEALCDAHPLIVAQPYAGLSDRDAFDSPSLLAMVEEIVVLAPTARIVVVGKNHERTHKYAREEVLFDHPNVVNLIDQEGIRFCYHLVSKCDAFVGSHSNLIRTAWDFRKRNVCVMPHPGMTSHMGNLDPKYRYGFVYPESKVESYNFDQDRGGPREFMTLNFGTVARWLLGR